jgi:hypothetical protein
MNPVQFRKRVPGLLRLAHLLHDDALPCFIRSTILPLAGSLRVRFIRNVTNYSPLTFREGGKRESPVYPDFG